MPQSEDPMYTKDQFKEKFGSTPTMLSGGRLHGFREGWALIGFGKAHYFTRCEDDISLAETKCGLFARVKGLFGAGSWDKCKRCQRNLDKSAAGTSGK